MFRRGIEAWNTGLNRRLPRIDEGRSDRRPSGTTLQDRELLAEGKVLDHQVGAVLGEGPKEGEKGRDGGHRRVPGVGMK